MHRVVHWNIDSVNLETLSGHIGNMSGTTNPMYYNAAASSFLPCHVDDEQLSHLVHHDWPFDSVERREASIENDT